MMIRKFAFAVAIAMGIGSSAQAATCNTPQGTMMSIVQALDALCVAGNDKGNQGYFANDPTVFGTDGWTLAYSNDDGTGDGALGFSPDLVNGTKSGSFGIVNPGGYSYLVALKAGNGVGLFYMDDLSTGLFNWSLSKGLSHASIWYHSDVSEVPLPVSAGFLMAGVGGLGAFGRRKRR